MQVDLSHQQSLLLYFCFTEQGLKVPLFIVSAIQWIGGYPEAKTTIVNGVWLCLPSCLVTVWPHYFCMFLYAMITYIWLFYFFSDWTMVFGPQRFPVLLELKYQYTNKNPAPDLLTFKSFWDPSRIEPQLNFLIDDKQHYCICQVSVVDCLCDGKIDIHRLASVSRFQKEQEGAKCEKKIFNLFCLIHLLKKSFTL